MLKSERFDQASVGIDSGANVFEIAECAVYDRHGLLEL